MIENTSKRDPRLHLAGSMELGAESYITGMEAQGQRDVVLSTQMPTKGPWDQLTELGFIAGPETPGDPLFREATLPTGWTKVPTEHSMWSDVLDDRGVARVAVFYKAAPYDRKAYCRLTQVGTGLALELIYGDGPARLPRPWDVLTADERADFVAALDSYAEEAKEHAPDDDLMPRVTALRALVEQI